MEKQSYSDYINAWMDMFNQVMPTNILIYSENGPFLDFIAAWNIVISLMINSDNNRLFKKIILVVPTCEINSTGKIIANINQILDQKAFPEARKLEIINGLEFIFVPTFQAESLLEQLNQIPKDVAVGVLYSSFYRFANIDIDEINDARITTWIGINNRTNTAEELYADHLIELVKKVLIISQEKEAFITFFCQYSAYLSPRIIKAFYDYDSVMYVEGTRGSVNEVDLEDFQKLAIQVGIKPIEELLNAIPSLSSDPINIAIMTSHLYFNNQQFLSAWQSIEPMLEEIVGSNNSTLILSTSNVAFSAGKVNEGIDLLNKVIQLGLLRLEELHQAYLLAEKSDQKGIANELFVKIRNLYPENELTKNIHYKRLIDERKYGEAFLIARGLGNEFGQILCETFSQEILNLEKFIEYGKRSDQLDRVLIAATSEAIHRNQLDIAENLISQVPPDSAFVEYYVKFRIYLWTKKLLSSPELDDEFVHELDPIISIIARNPNEVDYRFAVERLFLEEIEEPNSLVILSSLLLHRIRKSIDSINIKDLSNIWESQKVDFPSWDDIENDVIPLCKSIFISINNKVTLLGHGELNPIFEKRISKKFIGGLLMIIQKEIISGSPEFDTVIFPLLHVLTLACKSIKDPSSDFLAVRLIISGLCLNNFSQQARDMAEHSFILAANQLEYIEWRNGQAWSGYADAFHRSGNLLSALLNLTLSFYSWSGEALNYELLLRSIRLTSRIFRDTRLLSTAREMIHLERELLIYKKENQTELLELEQMDLSIEVLGLSISTRIESLEILLTRCDQLIEKCVNVGHEILPLLSLQATIFRLIYNAGGVVPTKTREKFEDLLRGVDNTNVDQLRAQVNLSPSKDDLSTALKKASTSNHLDDLVHQLYPVMIIAENAIFSACQRKDLDLFLMSSAVLSQPGLSINTKYYNDQSYESRLHFSELAKRWLMSYTQMATKDFDSAQLMEARQLVNQFLPKPDSFFNEIASLSQIEIRKILRDNEVLVILSEDVFGNLCRLIISSEDSHGPNALTKEIWARENYDLWRKQYPEKYGMWQPVGINERTEIVSRDDVLQSVKNLSIGDIPLIESKSIIICPSSNLFTFPFALSPIKEGFLSEYNPISIIPSATFLVQGRKNRNSDRRPIKAWLGAPETFDETMLHVRDELIPILNQFGIEIMESETPDPLADASIGIVVSHGSTGFLDHFTGVTDNIRFFSANDFANRLAGCGCVILFVCSAARVDSETASTEVRGLSRELLYRNVKAVIASTWSLNVDIPKLWLPTFLESINNCHSIGFSSFMAAQVVMKQFDNPCAWAALQVYGDPEFTPIEVRNIDLEEK